MNEKLTTSLALATLLAVGAMIYLFNRNDDRPHGIEDSTQTASGPQAPDSTRRPRSGRNHTPNESDPSLECVDDSTRAVEVATLKILDQAGRGIRNAEVFVFADAKSEEWDSTASDADGNAPVRARDRSMQVLVLAPARMPWLGSQEMSAGHHEITLPDGEELEGHVTVNRDVPPAPLKIKFSSSGPRPGAIEKALPEGLRFTLRERGGLAEIWTTTEANGKFRFRGIGDPEERGGILFSPVEYLIRNGERSQEILRVRPDQRPLHLELVKRHVLTAQIVDESTGKAVPDVEVVIDYPLDGSKTDFNTVVASSDGNGQLRFAVPAHDFGWLRLKFQRAGGIEEREVAAFRGARDLGKIEVASIRDVVIQVIDEDDKPVMSGAVAMLIHHGIRPGPAVSGYAGQLTMKGVATSSILIDVGAPGYVSRRMKIGPLIGTEVVRLQRGNHLEVQVVDKYGMKIRGYSVSLICDDLRGFFSGRSSTPPRIDRPREYSDGMTARHSRLTGRGFVNMGTGKRGRMHLHNLEPDTPFDLVVTSDFEIPVSPMKSMRIGKTEHKKVRLVVEDAMIRDLTFKILDEHGAPVAGAALRLQNPDGSAGTGKKSNRDGLVVFEDCTIQEARVIVEAEGLAPFQDARMRFAPNDRPHEIRLDAGRELLVSVVDARGEAVAADVWASLLGIKMRGSLTPDARDRFEHLPTGTVEIVARYGKRLFKRRVASDRGSLEIAVPETGDLNLRWSPLPPFPASLCVRVRNPESQNLDEGYTQALKDPASLSESVGALIVGDYQVTLERLDRVKRRWVVLRGPVSATISADKVSTIDLN